MWRNSRRWLVKDESHMERKTLKRSHNIERSNFSMWWYHTAPPTIKLKYPPRQSRSGPRSGHLVRNSPRSPLSRQNVCLNQNLKVLLVILVANCLLCTADAAMSPSKYWQDLQLRRSLALPPAAFEQSYATNEIIDDGFQTSSDTLHLHRSQNFKISPKPCAVGRIEGTCMFVWECIKSEGRHVGMCVDSFMFGSCCAHNYTENIILPQAFSYTRPTKPIGISSLNHRPRPPHLPHRPSISGMTTIERPHGAGTLVIRPSGPHHQGALHKPSKAPTLPTTTSTKPSITLATENPNPPWPSNSIGHGQGDSQPAESISSSSFSSLNLWASTSTSKHQYWHMTTEPNFITKPRPPSWEKPATFRPKPPPTKKPSMPPSSTSIVYSTRRPHPTTLSLPTTIQWNHKPPQVSNNVKPVALETTSNQFLGATTSNNVYDPFSSIGTTTFKYRPSTLKPTTSHWSTSTLTSSSASSSSSSSSSTSTLTSTQTHKPTVSSALNPSHESTQSLNTITFESNEIADSHTNGKEKGGMATIKTVSAARGVECGMPILTRPETRIVGGKSAAFGRWPWQVSVRRTSFFGFSSTHRCGGALINENWIATAGHCVDDLLTSQIRIRVGEYDFSHVQEQLPYIERGVAQKVVHPKYNFFTYEYDLALVKLEQPLEFAPHVSPICLPETDSLMIGMNATVTGWGRLSEGGTLPSVLQEVSVPIVSNDNCKTMFLRAGRQEFIPDIFLCAGYETGGQDSCQGDSGGPLQVKSQNGRFFLAGIISWGIGCAEANLPGVCTRISKFVPWILEHVT